MSLKNSQRWNPGVISFFLVGLLVLFLASGPLHAQDQGSQSRTTVQDTTKRAPDTGKTVMSDARPAPRFMSGAKQKISGVIVKSEADGFILREPGGADLSVKLTSDTKVQEKKSNPFRDAKHYAPAQLFRGLNVEVEGRGDQSGALVAEKIRFTNDDLMVAQTVESRVTPVEGRMNQAEARVSEAETRLTQSEQNAQRLAGQIEELNVISNAARGGAKAAQETADFAVSGVSATNDRITALDEYEAQKSIMVNFKAGSAVLSAEAKAALDEIAAQAKTQKGFVIEVTGFASSDGSQNFNRQLSRRRAEAVVRYLADDHMIPLRRIIMPYGYGEGQPVADNSTREGRQQNRRVEVKILVSRGLTTPVDLKRQAPTGGGGQGN